MKKQLVFFEAVFLLVGTIIGAGYLVLPYSFLKAGWLANVFWLAAFGFFVTLLHLFYAEVILATGNSHRFPGYVRIYLGKKAEIVAAASFVLGVFGSLLVYLLLGARFLGLLIKPVLPLAQELIIFVFWLLATALVLAKLKLSARINFYITTITLSLFLILSSLAFLKIDYANFAISPAESFFFPYGLFLYALIGSMVIPEIVNLLKIEHQKINLIKPVIIVGTLIPALVYLFFSLSIFGASGAKTSEEAISGLTSVLPAFWVYAGILLAFLEIMTSYLAFGINTVQTFAKDFNFGKLGSKAAVALLPLGLFFIGINNFVQVMGVLGSVLISTDSIFVVLMFIKLKKKYPDYRHQLISISKPVVLALIGILLVGGGLGLYYSLF
ncbi:MAG: aromatic amino acid transport family protein [Patescibacteria group bacterium]